MTHPQAQLPRSALPQLPIPSPSPTPTLSHPARRPTRQVLRDVDTDNDGQVNYDEFLECMRAREECTGSRPPSVGAPRAARAANWGAGSPPRTTGVRLINMGGGGAAGGGDRGSSRGGSSHSSRLAGRPSSLRPKSGAAAAAAAAS
eukprot:355939-Chlamydomonas_euryale.AAC.2